MTAQLTRLTSLGTCLLLAACIQLAPGLLEYSCTDGQSEDKFLILTKPGLIEISMGEQNWVLSPIEEVGAVLVFSETRPGEDDERIITERLFRFDRQSGHTYLLEKGSLIFQGTCPVNQFR